MELTTEQESAARVLLALPEADRVAALAAVQNQDQYAAEQAKDHPLRSDVYTVDALKAFKVHLLDGGGVIDDTVLVPIYMQSVHDEDWPTLFHTIPHILKSWAKQKNAVMDMGGGVVITPGSGPTVPAPILESVPSVTTKGVPNVGL